jgi:hypothetical protein
VGGSKPLAYNLGIDIGIASIGFAAVDLANKSIVCTGVHIFEAAENPKNGASLAAPRREKRGLRRVIHRRSQRKRAIRSLLTQYGINDVDVIDTKQSPTGAGHPPVTVWDLRRDALDRLLADEEFARVLYHIAKRRGFQSNRKGAEANDTDGKKALSGAKELQEAMVRANAPTVGAYLATLPKQRNGDGSYERFVTRDLLRDEIRKIFQAQRGFGNPVVNAALNYGYAVIRAFVARSQVAHGLLPTFGIHHDSELNAFNLVDDLIEVFRPFVDREVHSMKMEGILLSEERLLASVRQRLASIPIINCNLEGQVHTIATACDKMAAGLVSAIERNSAALLPVPSMAIG